MSLGQPRAGLSALSRQVARGDAGAVQSRLCHYAGKAAAEIPDAGPHAAPGSPSTGRRRGSRPRDAPLQGGRCVCAARISWRRWAADFPWVRSCVSAARDGADQNPHQPTSAPGPGDPNTASVTHGLHRKVCVFSCSVSAWSSCDTSSVQVPQIK